jgi:hypothetical protein
MTTISTEQKAQGNHNGNLADLATLRGFPVRILVYENSFYDDVIKYFGGISLHQKEIGDKTYFVFDKSKKQVARADECRRTIEFTKDVPREIRDEVEYILDIKQGRIK